MFDFPFKLMPPSILAGFALYGLACMLWLQPVIEARMAERTLIPQCEAHLSEARASAPNPHADRIHALELMIESYKKMGLDQLPGVGEMVGIAERELNQLRSVSLRTSNIRHVGPCSCGVDKAFAEAGYSMTWHVMSLRTYTSAPIRNLGQSALAFAGSEACKL